MIHVTMPHCCCNALISMYRLRLENYHVLCKKQTNFELGGCGDLGYDDGDDGYVLHFHSHGSTAIVGYLAASCPSVAALSFVHACYCTQKVYT